MAVKVKFCEQFVNVGVLPRKAGKIKVFRPFRQKEKPREQHALPGKGQESDQAFSTLAFLTPFLLLTRNRLHSMAMIYSTSVKYSTA